MLRCQLDRDERSTLVEYTCTAAAQSLPFYLQCYGLDYSRSGYFVERSGLESFLVIHTLSGCGVLRDSGAEIRLSPGSVALIDCNNYQYYGTSEGNLWNFEWLHFSGTAAPQFYSILSETGRLTQHNAACSMQFYDRLCGLAGQTGVETDICINHLITGLLSSFFTVRQQAAIQEQIGKYRDRLEEAAQYIRKHCRESIYVSEMAAAVSMSQFHFERLFKAYYGKTPYEFLTVERIAAAKQLLHSTSSSVAEIADMTGFSDASCFIRRFKSVTGLTPLKYRLFAIE